MNSCIIIPCYNEEKRLKIKEINSFLTSNPTINFLFVNDGSEDKTKDVLAEIDLENNNATALNLQKNVGKADTVRQGILRAIDDGYGHVGYFDADLATPLEEIPRFLSLFKNSKIELVMGTRILRLGGNIHRKWYRHFLGRLFATFASISLKLPVYDTQCGAKVFQAELAKRIFKDPFISYWIFDVELLFRMKQLKGPKELKNCIYELPLNQWIDEEGSKLGILSFIKAPLELLKMIRRYR